MKCLFCGQNTKVTNSRVRNYGVWRRRSCKNNHLFTTTERADLSEITVIKTDGHQEPFNSAKLSLSLSKCDVSGSEVVELQKTIVSKLLKSVANGNQTIETSLISETTHEILLAYDERYANRYMSYSNQLTD